MNNDTFTEAARAEAEDYARTPRMNVGTVRDRIAEAHQVGAEWARTHLAAREPTDAEIEAGANAIIALLTGVALSAARAARRDEEKRDG